MAKLLFKKYTVKNGGVQHILMGLPQTGLKLPPRVYSKGVYVFIGCKERSRILPKHIRIKCVWSLQGCDLFLKNANKGMW